MELEKRTAKQKAFYVGNWHFALLMALMAILLLAVFGFCQYTSEQKMRTYLQSFIGSIYENDAEWTAETLKIMFETEISAEKMETGQQALVTHGYTSEGMRFFMDAQRQMSDYLPLGIFVLCLAIFFLVFRWREVRIQRFIRQLQENMNEQEKKMKELAYVEVQNKRLQSFIENIAHQIKTPLSRVVTSLDLVLEELKEENINRNVSGRRLAKKIEETFTHLSVMRQLITRLINIGRMEAGAVLFSKEKLVLEELLYDSWNASVGERKGAQVEVQVTPFNADTIYRGDYEWLKEAFSNIFTNCAQHDKSGIPLEVTCRKFTEYYMIQIRDHGSGFCEEDIPNLFSRFYTPKNEKQGHVGIGLNLTRLILEGHNGTIHAANHEEGGAVFDILLPIYLLKEEKL